VGGLNIGERQGGIVFQNGHVRTTWGTALQVESLPIVCKEKRKKLVFQRKKQKG